MNDCPHEQFFIQDRDENADRIRTAERCASCMRLRYGCFGKRLDSEGRVAWAPVDGQWHYSWAE